MNSSDIPPATPEPEDHGEIVRAPRLHRIWAWIFPALAAAAGIWLLWSNWKSQGPEIEIRFTEAPGIQAGKSTLFYRGIPSGKVTSVRLNRDLAGVVVSVRLKSFAAGLATEGTEYWIDQPVISLRETSGLESIIQGNSIQARLREGTAPEVKFVGLPTAPLAPLDNPSLVVELFADDIPFLDRGAPIYHRGVSVGVVRAKKFNAEGRPYLQAVLDENHADKVSSHSRFWVLPATSLQLSARGATINFPGLDALVQGGIAFEDFSSGGDGVSAGAPFQLFANESTARADGPPRMITFDNGLGLIAGETRLSYLGQPVGLVEKVAVDPGSGTVEVTARFESKYDRLANTATVFTLVRPRVSLQGVSGLETLVTGPYIACEPGPGGEPAERFAGRSVSSTEWEKANSERDGVRVWLTADKIPTIGAGAPVYYRGLVAGSVLGKSLDRDGRPVLQLVIGSEFRNALRAGSRFWRVPATSVSAGPGVLSVDVEGLAALVQGGVAFDSFGASGDPAAEGSAFQLFATEGLAAATSAPLRISFKSARGLLAGKSELRYLGQPVGLVDEIRTEAGHVEVQARLRPGFEALRRQGSEFVIVQPNISLADGITGIETLVSGIYIDCIPGSGSGYADAFKGKLSSDDPLASIKGFPIRLTSSASTLRPGAEVSYRDMVVGELVSKSLSKDAQGVVMNLVIQPKYAHLIRENSRFWDASSIGASIGFIKIQIHSQTLLDPNGRIAFANPEDSGEPVEENHAFELYPVSQRRIQGK